MSPRIPVLEQRPDIDIVGAALRGRPSSGPMRPSWPCAENWAGT